MRQRPRVLIVVTLAETGGAQTYVASLLPALVERFDVVVAAHGPGPLFEAARAAGARFVAARARPAAAEPVARSPRPARARRAHAPGATGHRPREQLEGRRARAPRRGCRRACRSGSSPCTAGRSPLTAASPSALYQRAERLMRPLTTRHDLRGRERARLRARRPRLRPRADDRDPQRCRCERAARHPRRRRRAGRRGRRPPRSDPRIRSTLVARPRRAPGERSRP